MVTGGATGFGIGPKHCVQHGPVNRIHAHPPQQREEHDREYASDGRAEQLAPPCDPAVRVDGSVHCQPRNATRALYKFIAPEIDSDKAKYTAMMMAMHSKVRPVELNDVLAIDISSG